MTEVDGYLIGSGGMVGRIDPNEPPIAPERRLIHWDRTITPGHNAGGHELVRARKVDGTDRWLLIFVAANVCLAGAPKWECGTDLNRQFETRPIEKAGGDERWLLVTMPDGRIQAQTIFDWNGGVKFSSVPVTFVENK